MNMPRSQQAAQRLGKNDLVSVVERVDDVALRIGPMVPMGFPAV